MAREVELNLLFHLRDIVPGLDGGKKELKDRITPQGNFFQ